ncbi:MAG: hypothetical protein K5866_10440 [Treponema sp.]|nr:hypothetical protein [Treponema sp.]
MKKVLAFVFVTFLILQSITAEIKVISPIEGQWANKQMLILETQKNEEYYYSLNGSDPATFGFAYDGPVILDVTGPVTLRISHILPDKSQEEKEISFTVKNEDAFGKSYYDFVQSFYSKGILFYSSGSPLKIPGELHYTFSEEKENFIGGKTLFLDENNVISRYLPIIVSDLNNDINYRFIIKTQVSTAGVFSRKDLPFVIEDWERITFTDQNLLFKIDEEYWGMPKESRLLDRSISHMIYWQDLNYEPGNPVEYFVLPPKAELMVQNTPGGGLLYYLDSSNENDYSICIHSDTNDSKELFKKIGIDTFDGDKLKGQLTLDIYSNSLYQGSQTIDYNINKAPVSLPKITSNAKDFYSLEKVLVDIQLDSSDLDLYVAVSQPLTLPEVNGKFTKDDSRFQFSLDDYFQKVSGPDYKLTLEGIGEGATFYKIQAYASDGSKNSLISEYNVIVDEYNFYYDLNANPELQNGTIENPFASLDKCLESVNKSRSVCIHIKGDLYIPSGKHFITANCQLKTSPDSQIIFEPGASLVVQSSSLNISNTRIKNSADSAYQNIVPLFKLENSVLTLEDTIISAAFEKNGTVIDAFNSVLDVDNCMVSITAPGYASFLAANKSKLNIEASTINTFADTSVIISDNNNQTNLYKNTMKVVGRTGRIIECFGSKTSLSENSFKAQFTGKSNVSPVYTNKSASVKETNNEYTGF